MTELQLSRSALDQFIRCPCCFYQNKKLGLKPPAMVPLTLAVATDALLKNEFDAIRGTDIVHPVWLKYGLRVRAFQHAELDNWRSARKGIRVQHASGVTVYGAVDDVWENLDTGELHIVDYKSTSKKGLPSIDDGWGDAYKRQIEIYQWLFRRAGFAVNQSAYFLYVNGSKDGKFYQADMEGMMKFSTVLIPYDGDDAWVDGVVRRAVACLEDPDQPSSGAGCDNCRYFNDRLRLGLAKASS